MNEIIKELDYAIEAIETMKEQIGSDDTDALQTFFEFYLHQQENMGRALDKALTPVVQG